jgi:uncharacterized protein YqjF (DUF2071 family)
MVDPMTPDPPHRIRRVMSTQWWRDVTLLHWPADVAAVADLLPPGITPDTHDGRTYVGLVAFRMDRVGPLSAPGVPYLGRFPETNVRLYSVDRQGRRGVVFRSMDAARMVPVLLGRLALGLPYVWSRMRVDTADDRLTYECRRRDRPAVRSRIVVRIGEPVERPTPLEHFLTARWALHSGRGGRTWYVPNWHPRWALHRADLLDLDDGLVGAAGLARPAGPPVSALYSPGVPARFGWPTRG